MLLLEKKNKNEAAVFYGPDNIVNEEVYYSYNDKKGGVSLRVNACAVCGYDARVFRNGHRKVTPPVILGHEICGQIDKDVLVTNTANESAHYNKSWLKDCCLPYNTLHQLQVLL